jgi:hypothetical protein
MSPADRQAIATLVNRFVNDAVKRKDLAAAWALAGPDLRGGTTRSAWIAGTGVTVPAYPAAGSDFRKAWTGRLVSPGRAELAMILQPEPGSHANQEGASLDVRRIRGRWVVDLFYVDAVFRSGSGKHGSCGTANCAISGPNDYAAAGDGGASGASPTDGALWMWVGLSVFGAIVLLTPLGLWVRVRLRDRRILAEYAAHMRP